MGEPAKFGKKQTRRSVLVADWLADRIITVGGLLVIAAVFGMMVFLVGVVLPLFRPAAITGHAQYATEQSEQPVVALCVDEFKTTGIQILADGSVQVRHLRTGTAFKVPSLDFGGRTLTASARTIDTQKLAMGFSDGTVRFATLGFETEILPETAVPEGARRLDARDQTDGTAVYSAIPGKQVRKVAPKISLEDEIPASDAHRPIAAMDYRLSGFEEHPGKTLAVVDDQGHSLVIKAESRMNIMTRKVTTDVEKATLPTLEHGISPAYVLVNDSGETVFVAEKNGTVHRFNVRDFGKPFLAETTRITPQGVDLTAFGFLLGDASIVAGGSDGSVHILFEIRRDDAKTSDGLSLVCARTLAPQPAPVIGLCPGRRGKTFASADAQGGIWVRHATSERTLAKLQADPHTAGMVLTPRQDGLLAVGKAKTDLWDLRIEHPETSWRTLFGKVWYEGHPEPTYTWQSTGATDGFEPKLSLVPLIFGTLKATFYSLLFAVPLSLLAAIHTSEFLHPSTRGKIKPAIEVMASIPSVVLGFMAALVMAPIVENWIAAVLLGLFVLPASLILAACLWQLLPPVWALRLDGLPKLAAMTLLIGAALYLTWFVGPWFEKAVFAGDFKHWLNGDAGRAAPFLFVLLFPVCAVGVSSAASRLVGPRFRALLKTLSPFRAGCMDLLRLLGMAAITAAVSWALALLLERLGVDARDGLVGTYVQRNTLVVGFAMGFAVIPIIYTLAEDALNAVPEHLRSASLGCGATPWQTALWIVLPTAISGVFSAIMIGMGRAVGETMIVVMSAGNTALIDLNVFNGLRALSANIAVELPEAPKGDTLYRVLFLTGLVLFAMTFVINTVAEMVRLRFRKRSMQL
ncbi:MAG: ABC transporter permease subunit [Thermodesulfobacteriota bacterium]